MNETTFPPTYIGPSNSSCSSHAAQVPSGGIVFAVQDTMGRVMRTVLDIARNVLAPAQNVFSGTGYSWPKVIPQNASYWISAIKANITGARGIVARRLDATSHTPFGSEIPVSPPATNHKDEYDGVALPNGNIVFGWIEGAQLYHCLRDPGGNLISPPKVQVDPNTGGEREGVKIVPHDDGGYTFTYHDDSFFQGLKFARFDAAGSRLDDDYLWITGSSDPIPFTAAPSRDKSHFAMSWARLSGAAQLQEYKFHRLNLPTSSALGSVRTLKNGLTGVWNGVARILSIIPTKVNDFTIFFKNGNAVQKITHLSSSDTFTPAEVLTPDPAENLHATDLVGGGWVAGWTNHSGAYATFHTPVLPPPPTSTSATTGSTAVATTGPITALLTTLFTTLLGTTGSSTPPTTSLSTSTTRLALPAPPSLTPEDNPSSSENDTPVAVIIAVAAVFVACVATVTTYALLKRKRAGAGKEMELELEKDTSSTSSTPETPIYNTLELAEAGPKNEESPYNNMDPVKEEPIYNTMA